MNSDSDDLALSSSPTTGQVNGVRATQGLPPIVLTRRQAAAVIRLLGELQTDLESAIESCVFRDETEPRDPVLKPVIAEQRRMWTEAEGIVGFLEAMLDKQRLGKRAETPTMTDADIREHIAHKEWLLGVVRANATFSNPETTERSAKPK